MKLTTAGATSEKAAKHAYNSAFVADASSWFDIPPLIEDKPLNIAGQQKQIMPNIITWESADSCLGSQLHGGVGSRMCVYQC